MPTQISGYASTIDAANSGSISLMSCSKSPIMPDLTMLIKAKMRVLAKSMTVRLKCRKCFAPAVPVSTIVVTPERNE